MNINLRKASSIQSELHTLVTSVELKTHVDITEFDMPKSVLSIGNTELNEELIRLVQMEKVLVSLRKKIAIANVKSGITDCLADDAGIKRAIGRLESVVRLNAMKEVLEIQQRLDKIKNAGAEGYGYRGSDSVKSSVLSKQELDAFRTQLKALKRKRREINDALLTSNIQTEIELTADEVKLLEMEGIL